MTPHIDHGEVFPPSPFQTFGPEGDQTVSPPLPVGRLIAPPDRPVTRAPLLQEAGPSEGQGPPSASAAGGLPLQLVRNISLKSGPAVANPISTALTPADGSEQSVATNGRGLVLYTTNVQDGFSVNGGRSFYPLDPAKAFPSAAGGFCCDQVVTYVPSVDRFVWILQYWNGNAGAIDNTQQDVIRVATATSAGFMSCRARCWSYYDWTPSELGAKAPARGTTVSLDRPHMAFSHSMLSLTAAFTYYPGNKVFGSVIWRFPLAQLGNTLYPTVVPVQASSFAAVAAAGDFRFVPAQNNIFDNSSSQFFANRQSTSRLNVVRWLDGDPSPVFFEIDVPTIATQNNGGPADAAPSGSDWAARYTSQDGAVVTGARTGRVIWFGWNAGRDAPKPGGGVIHVHDQPAVEFVGIDAATLLAVDYDSIEYTNAATVNPQISVNREGELGVDFMFGGPTINPSYAVGFLRRDYAAAVASAGGAADPSGLGTSGDYLGLAPDPEQGNCFVAGGSAIKVLPSTATRPTSLYHDPHYVVFGRASHCTVPPTTLTDIAVTAVNQSADGRTLAILGALSPPVSGALVSVIYTPPHGPAFSHEVLTDAQGRFTDTAVVADDQAGPWSVTARWFGQGRYIGAEAAASGLNVTRPTPRPSSTLTIACPASLFVPFGNDSTFSGTLSPPVAGSTVTLSYERPTMGAVTHTVTTDASGNYTDVITGDDTGNWRVGAQFAGDGTRAPSASPLCTFMVGSNN